MTAPKDDEHTIGVCNTIGIINSLYGSESEQNKVFEGKSCTNNV